MAEISPSNPPSISGSISTTVTFVPKLLKRSEFCSDYTASNDDK